MMKRILLITSFLLVFGSQGQTATSPYQALVRYVKGASNPSLIPRTDPNKPLKVDFQAAWIDLQNVDYERGVVEGIFLVGISWNSSITWNRADFHGKDKVVVSSNALYVPTVGVTNAAGELEQWLNDVAYLRSDGRAYVQTEARGKIYCDDLETNTCRFRAGTGGSFNDVIAFVEPSERWADLNDTFGQFYFKGSHYDITSQRYEIHRNRFQMMASKFEYEYMDYVFSFKEKHGGHHHHERPKTLVFNFS